MRRVHAAWCLSSMPTSASLLSLWLRNKSELDPIRFDVYSLRDFNDSCAAGPLPPPEDRALMNL